MSSFLGNLVPVKEIPEVKGIDGVNDRSVEEGLHEVERLTDMDEVGNKDSESANSCYIPGESSWFDW